MILGLLRWLGRRRPYFDIYGLSPPHPLYMGRWWLLGGSHPMRDERDDAERGWARGRLDLWVGRLVGVRLHHIARPDNELEFHDHPSAFLSVVVRGWYVEELPTDQSQPPADDTFWRRTVRRRTWSVRFRRGTDRHAIREVSPEGGAWTVFVMFGRKWNEWGFYTADGRVPSQRYFRGERAP